MPQQISSSVLLPTTFSFASYGPRRRPVVKRVVEKSDEMLLVSITVALPSGTLGRELWKQPVVYSGKGR